MAQYTNIFKRKKSYLLAVCLIAIIVLSVTLSKPIKLSPDSEGYMTAAIYRSPIYPMFLAALNVLFGSFKDLAMVAIQTLAGLGASFYLISALKKHTHIKSVSSILLFAMLVFPYISEQQIGNRVLSEGLAYPLYLVSIALLFKGFMSKQVKYLLQAVAVLLLLQLTRSQFLFLVPIAIAISFWLFKNNKVIKKSLLAGVLFILLPLVVQLSNKTYHLLKHEHFVSTPWTGIVLLTPAMFVAQEADVDLYQDKREITYFKNIFSSLKQQGLNVNHKLDPNSNDIDIYIEEYGNIANATLFYEGIQLLKGINTIEDSQITNEDFILIDHLTKSMTPALVWRNKVDWLKIYIQNVVHGFGGITLCLLFVILFVVALFDFIRKPALLNKTILFFTCCALANIAIVSIGMHTIQRFTFYNDWVIFLVLFLIIDRLHNQNTLPNAR